MRSRPGVGEVVGHFTAPEHGVDRHYHRSRPEDAVVDDRELYDVRAGHRPIALDDCDLAGLVAGAVGEHHGQVQHGGSQAQSQM